MVQKFSLADASFERSPGQENDVFAANLIDQRHGGPITIGYGKYGPGQGLSETIAVYDVMVVLEGGLEVSASGKTFSAGQGEIVYMPKGSAVSITAKDGATTAYVTYPHWQESS